MIGESWFGIHVGMGGKWGNNLSLTHRFPFHSVQHLILFVFLKIGKTFVCNFYVFLWTQENWLIAHTICCNPRPESFFRLIANRLLNTPKHTIFCKTHIFIFLWEVKIFIYSFTSRWLNVPRAGWIFFNKMILFSKANSAPNWSDPHICWGMLAWWSI